MANYCAQCKNIDLKKPERRYLDVLYWCNHKKTLVMLTEEYPCFEPLTGQTKEVIKEIIKEVQGPERIVEKIVEKEIIKEVPVEVIKEVIIYKEKEEEPEEAEVFVCDICGKIYAQESSLKRHLTMKHPEVVE